MNANAVRSSRCVCIAIANHDDVWYLSDLATHDHQTLNHANFDDLVCVQYCLDVMELMAAKLSLRNLFVLNVDCLMTCDAALAAGSLEPSQYTDLS